MQAMNNALFAAASAALVALSSTTALAEAHEDAEAPKWSIAIHGGAGTLSPDNMTPERRAEYEAALQEALDAGAKILAEGGSAMDAIQAAIMPMEDSPLFNAGRGAVFTNAGKNELDASIMEGKSMNAGAVAGVAELTKTIGAKADA